MTDLSTSHDIARDDTPPSMMGNMVSWLFENINPFTVFGNFPDACVPTISLHLLLLGKF